jgi:hypothetical protein
MALFELVPQLNLSGTVEKLRNQLQATPDVRAGFADCRLCLIRFNEAQEMDSA